LPKWLALIAFGLGGLIVGAAIGWLFAQLFAEPAAKVSVIEVGAVLGAIFSIIYRDSASSRR
jgi:hypothetical protein